MVAGGCGHRATATEPMPGNGDVCNAVTVSGGFTILTTTICMSFLADHTTNVRKLQWAPLVLLNKK